jgi:hypothetical protein
MVSVGMQSGYALGILALVPLGDILERRRLLVVMFFAFAIARVLPSRPPHATLRYGELLRSVFSYVSRHAALGAVAADITWQLGGWNAVCALQIGWILAMAPVLLWLRRLLK